MEVHINAGEPVMANFSRGMLLGRIGFLLDVPLALYFPDEI